MNLSLLTSGSPFIAAFIFYFFGLLETLNSLWGFLNHGLKTTEVEVQMFEISAQKVICKCIFFFPGCSDPDPLAQLAHAQRPC